METLLLRFQSVFDYLLEDADKMAPLTGRVMVEPLKVVRSSMSSEAWNLLVKRMAAVCHVLSLKRKLDRQRDELQLALDDEEG